MRFAINAIGCAVSTHSRPKAAGIYPAYYMPLPSVSTHSRPKAAGFFGARIRPLDSCFNTQPPEGGWS